MEITLPKIPYRRQLDEKYGYQQFLVVTARTIKVKMLVGMCLVYHRTARPFKVPFEFEIYYA
jgi:hypothetical protein